jgi:hypothetical protein
MPHGTRSIHPNCLRFGIPAVTATRLRGNFTLLPQTGISVRQRCFYVNGTRCVHSWYKNVNYYNAQRLYEILPEFHTRAQENLMTVLFLLYKKSFYTF